MVLYRLRFEYGAVQSLGARQSLEAVPEHLPLYRQSQIYAREGHDLDRSTPHVGSLC